jgi:hypothetical protein
MSLERIGLASGRVYKEKVEEGALRASKVLDERAGN